MSSKDRGRWGAGVVALVVFVIGGCSSGATSSPTNPPGPTVPPAASPMASIGIVLPSATVAPSPSTSVIAGSGDCAADPAVPAGRIAFDIGSGESHHLAVVSPRGADFRELTPPGTGYSGAAAWRPDGRLVFASDRVGHVHLYSTDADGAKVKQLTSGDGDEGYPSVSPDGSVIAVDGNTVGKPQGLWLIGADGARQRRLTTSPAADGFDTGPEFSPDGRSIAFARVLDATPGTARSAIFVVDVGAGPPRQLTDWALNAVHPTWSADGTRIAFSSNADNNSPTRPADLWVVGADGSGLAQLTHEPAGGNAYEPTWSPDGAWLAFSDGGLAVMSADGTHRCVAWRAGPGSGFVSDPAWGPG